jgi:outer membrane protein
LINEADVKLKSIFFVMAATFAGSVQAVDLMDAWRAAQAYDANFSAAKSAQLAGQEKAVQGRSLLLPQVGLGANLNHARIDSSPGNPTPTNPQMDKSGQTYGYSVRLTQPIYRQEAFVAADQLSKQSQLADLQFRVAEQNLILRVAQSYFDVLTAQENVVLSAAQREAVAQQLAQAKRSFDVGSANINDVNAAQARYDGIVATEIIAANELDIRQNAFQLITSLDSAHLATAANAIEATLPVPNDLKEWQSRTETGSFDLLAQRLNLDIVAKNIELYRLQDSPTLDLVASYGQNFDGSGLSRNGGTDRLGTGVIGVQFSVPLYTGGRRSSQLRESLANRDQQVDRVEATRRDALQTNKQAFLGVSAGAAQIRALQQALASSKSLLDSTKLGHEVGVSTMLDVLDANQRYYETRYRLVVAKYNYIFSTLQLAASTGVLNEQVLQHANQWFSASR